MADGGREDDRADLVTRLRERERQLEEAMDVGRIVPWEWNIQADVVKRALDRKLFGAPAANLETFLKLVHPDDRDGVRIAVRDTIERDLPYAVTYRRILGSEVRWFYARANLKRDGDGRPQKLVGVVVDVTERKELELRLEQSQKMEAIGLLAGGVAHDLNNVLTTVLGNAHLLRDDATFDASLVDEIITASERAATLIKQLLAFSRRQLVTRTSVVMDTVVDEVLALTRRTLGEDIEIVVDRDASPLYVLGDDAQLTQVLLNLVLNARDAMPTGGELRIAVRAVSVDGADGHRLGLAAGEYVRLSVADTGVGMEAGVQARVFEPFFTTKEFGRGTGLGLATVYGTVTQLSGVVKVESAPGRGTRFDVYLPRTMRPPAATPAELSGHARARGRSVLLVEDDDSVRRIAHTVLSGAGYVVKEAATPALALAAVQLSDQPIDLLVTDVVMPGSSGIALADKLRGGRADLKVLFMSGYADDAVFRRGMLEPDVTMLRKPFTPQALLAAVTRALGTEP